MHGHDHSRSAVAALDAVTLVYTLLKIGPLKMSPYHWEQMSIQHKVFNINALILH